MKMFKKPRKSKDSSKATSAKKKTRKKTPSKKAKIDRCKIFSYGFLIVGEKNNAERKGHVKCRWCQSCTRKYDLDRKYLAYEDLRVHSEREHPNKLAKMKQTFKELDTMSETANEEFRYEAAANKVSNRSLVYPLDTKESCIFKTHEVPRDMLRLLKMLGFKETQSRSPFDKSTSDIEYDDEERTRTITIHNPKRFNAIVFCVALSSSYEAIVKQWNRLESAYGNLQMKELDRSVPKIGILALLSIKNVLCNTKGFSLAIDAAALNIGGLRFKKTMGIRFCICIKNVPHSFYVAHLPISLTEDNEDEEDQQNTPTENTRDTVVLLLDSLSPTWRSKLVGTHFRKYNRNTHT